MANSTALLIGTDPSLVEPIQGSLRSLDHLHLTIVAGLDEAHRRLQRDRVVLLLVHMTEKTPLDEVRGLLQTVTALKQSIAVLVLSDRYHADHALALLRHGAADYLSRPLDLRRLAYLADVLTVRSRYTAPGAQPAPQPGPVQRIGERDPFLCDGGLAMGKLMEQVLRVAPQETTLLLTGETGTGKTRLARLIHEQSPRRGQPLLVLHCGTLSASLIESELFGHVKGAFTGADRDRIGKFAEAARGTLLLDEIDALPPPLQSKLLRATEERVFEPVGSNKTLPVQARLIAATNRVLDEEVNAGRFRADLFYRLNVVTFHLPPLRERPQLIPPLAAEFVREFAARNNRSVHGISDEVLQALDRYSWPGNVRELRNVIERAVALCPSEEVQLDDLPEALSSSAEPLEEGGGDAEPILTPFRAAGSLAQTKEDAEALHISEVLRRHRNNRQRAAAELGISRMTLYKKLHRYGLMEA
jgi:two-component system response regulator HydG